MIRLLYSLRWQSSVDTNLSQWLQSNMTYNVSLAAFIADGLIIVVYVDRDILLVLLCFYTRHYMFTKQF